MYKFTIRRYGGQGSGNFDHSGRHQKNFATVQSVHQPVAMPDFSIRGYGPKTKYRFQLKKYASVELPLSKIKERVGDKVKSLPDAPISSKFPGEGTIVKVTPLPNVSGGFEYEVKDSNGDISKVKGTHMQSTKGEGEGSLLRGDAIKEKHTGSNISIIGPVADKGKKGVLKEVRGGFAIVEMGGKDKSFHKSDLAIKG